MITATEIYRTFVFHIVQPSDSRVHWIHLEDQIKYERNYPFYSYGKVDKTTGISTAILNSKNKDKGNYFNGMYYVNFEKLAQEKQLYDINGEIITEEILNKKYDYSKDNCHINLWLNIPLFLEGNLNKNQENVRNIRYPTLGHSLAELYWNPKETPNQKNNQIFNNTHLILRSNKEGPDKEKRREECEYESKNLLNYANNYVDSINILNNFFRPVEKNIRSIIRNINEKRELNPKINFFKLKFNENYKLNLEFKTDKKTYSTKFPIELSEVPVITLAEAFTLVSRSIEELINRYSK